MSDSLQNATFTLGGVVFDGFETPSQIGYGTKQAITTHRLPGGGRVFDAMGGDPAPITWSGTWLGLGRYEKQASVEALRKAGKIVTVTWGKWTLPVLIETINYTERFQQIDYNMTVLLKTVTKNPDAPDQPNDPATGSGETPSTPQAASDTGQQAASSARAVAPTSIPVPPIPPGH